MRQLDPIRKSHFSKKFYLVPPKQDNTNTLPQGDKNLTKKMAVLTVTKMGNPILRKVSKHIFQKEIETEKFQTFVDDLIETMRDEDGAGIAAPQVGELKRVFIMEVSDNPRYPDKEGFPLFVAVNPEIKPVGEKKVAGWEGCLSIPGIRGKTERCEKVMLKALDRLGKPYEVELSGFAAVVAQHELDHLNGVLFIDTMEDLSLLSFEEEFEKYHYVKA